ncbi:hypothetical protein IKP85_02410 [bacterium]|nr:hypothetical protein [bacterium]
MILGEFSKYLQQFDEEIISNKTTATKVLCEWIKLVINKNPKNHIDKIVHREIMLADNQQGDFIIVGKSDSGRVLVNALSNYALSYENFLMSRWLANKKPQDFQKN